MMMKKLFVIIVLSVFLIGCSNQVDGPTPKVPSLESDVPTPAVPPVEKPKEVPVETAPKVVEKEEPYVSPNVHQVELNLNGFKPSTIKIKVGDTVIWTNERRASTMKLGQIQGTRQCVGIKSSILNPGDTFDWTFDKAETCQFMDTITMSHFMDIVIE